MVEKPVEVVVVKEDEGFRRSKEIEVGQLRDRLEEVEREKKQLVRESEMRLGVLRGLEVEI